MSTQWHLRKGDTFRQDTLVWIETKAQLLDFIKVLDSVKEVTFDTETTGLEEHAVTGGPVNGGVAARAVMATFTIDRWPEAQVEPTTYILPLSHPHSPFLGHWRTIYTAVAQHLVGKNLIAHHAKFDSRYTLALTGVDLSPYLYWDTMISAYILDEAGKHALKAVAPERFGIESWKDADLSTPGAAERVPYHQLGIYAARDTYWTYRLYRADKVMLWLEADEGEMPESEEDWQAYALGRLAQRAAMASTRTLAEMEQRGFGIDLETTRTRLDELLARKAELEPYFQHKYSDNEFLTNQTFSLAPTSRWFKEFAAQAMNVGELKALSWTPNGNIQWDKRVLKRLSRDGYEVAERILEYRDVAKQAEFLDSWLDKAHAGRIHSTYNNTKVVTGRLSSCLSPDTLIDMPRDMVKFPDGVPMREVKAGDWVYAFDYQCELTLRQVEWVGPTKVAETIYITFENSDGDQRVLQATPDHLVRLYNGDYRAAAYLMRSAGQWGGTQPPRVMGMVRRQWKNRGGNDNYLTFFPHANGRKNPPSVGGECRYGSTSGGESTEHRWVMSKVLGKGLSTKFDVNHIDGSKVNNTPSNLEYLSASEHRAKSFVDGTRGAEQVWPEVFTGKTDWRAVDIQPGPVIEVWDMTVPEDHCFVANGIVVHNSGPNMQQVSKKLKPAFIPSPGFYLAEIDYSQIELRVAAHIAREEQMISAFNHGNDLHQMFGARLTGKTDLSEVTKEERQKAKSANFGLLYGMGAEGFQIYAETAYGVDVSMEEAERIRNEFFVMWPDLKKWHASFIGYAQQNGYVVSPLGRVRRIPNIHSQVSKFRSEAQRQAINAPVQGMASDIMQLAASMIAGHVPGARVPEARLVGTVHDSIVVEVPQSSWQETTQACLDVMTKSVRDYLASALNCTLRVPLAAEAEVGERWGESSIGELANDGLD